MFHTLEDVQSYCYTRCQI